MVSALSSRLFKTSPPSSENGDSTKIELESFSGYSADRETPPLSPQGVLFDLQSEKRTRGKDENTRNKRRKISEQNFKASNVKNDLAKAGRAYPSLVTSRSRIIPHLDMSGVKIISSASVSDSPFLYPYVSRRNNYGSLESVRSLLKETSFAYKGPDTSDTTVDDYEPSTTSSITDPQSDSCVEPRIEEEVIDERKTTITPNIVSYCPTTYMTMGEAIAISDSSRLITVAKAPYEIVFMNAAYALQTGSSSNNTLGKSLSDILSPHYPSSIISSEPKLTRSNNTGEAVYQLAADEKSQKILKYHLKVTPIGSQNQSSRNSVLLEANRQSITHFAIDFKRQITSQNEGACNNERAQDEGYGAISVVG